MYLKNTSLPGEKTLGTYGALTLTNRRVIGEENAIDLALGGIGKMASKFIGFPHKNVSGSVTEIRLDKIDSIKFTVNRRSVLLKISNALWAVTLVLLLLVWLVAPYRQVSTAFVNVLGFVLNLVTLGFLKGFFEPVLESLLSIISGSYETPATTFVASVVFFILYALFKDLRLEIHSAKNFAFTNILDLSARAGIEESQRFAKRVREAENAYKKN